MRKQWAMALALIAIALGPASLAHAASTPAQKCSAAKLKAANKKTAADLRCHKKAVLAGQPVDAGCLGKSQQRFERAFANAEAKGGCGTEGDAAEVAASIDAYVADLVDALEPPKSFAADVQPIFNARCTSCHTGEFGPAQLDLSASASYGEIVGIPSFQQAEVLRVAPGDPAASYLFRKITNTGGISNNPMPLGNFPMSDGEIETIEEWIAQGALDN
jgi:hypothetical protein